MSKSDPGARERSAGTQSCEASYSRFIYAFLENWTTIAHINCIYFGAKITSFRLGQSSALETMEDVEKVFTELICTLEKKRSEIKEQIGAQEKTEIDRAEELHKHLDQELTELRKRQTKIKKLLRTDDQIHCLKVMKVISRAVLVNLTTVPCLSGVPKHLFYLYLNRVNPRLLGAPEPYRDRVATTEVQNAWSSRDSCRLQIVPGSALAGNSNCKNRVTELRFLVISRQ